MNLLVGLLIEVAIVFRELLVICLLHCSYLTTISSNLKMGAKPTTITGLSGTGDIMLTCFVNLSRNKTVGVRLGSGEKLDDILSSMSQVLESSYYMPLTSYDFCFDVVTWCPYLVGGRRCINSWSSDCTGPKIQS